MHEDDYLAISCLNDLLFCERRAARHLIQAAWTDNVHTVSGTIAHRRVHRQRDSIESGVRCVRGVRLVSHRLGLVGIADLVEFHQSAGAADTPYPIEYKRGRKRRWDNDDVQLCAQAICLEEMLGLQVLRGAIFHVRSRQRREITIDYQLRSKTEDAARRLHQLIHSRQTPPPVYHKKCHQCSLFDLCLPTAIRPRATASRYLRQILQEPAHEDST